MSFLGNDDISMLPIQPHHLPTFFSKIILNLKFLDEMRMRKEYYAKNQIPSPALAQSAGQTAATPNGSEAVVTSSDQTSGTNTGKTGEAPPDAVNGTDDEKISLSLEYSHE